MRLSAQVCARLSRHPSGDRRTGRIAYDIGASTFLIVDPLDGTKEFIKRRGDFTVNIAYVEDGAPVRGIVYAPAKDRLFYTDAARCIGRRDRPVSTWARRATRRRSRVSNPDNNALLVVASKSHRDQATDDYIDKYATADMKSAGSSLKFCLVATGEADLYPRVGPHDGMGHGSGTCGACRCRWRGCPL